MAASGSVTARMPFWMQLTWKISPKLGPTSARSPKSITAKAAPSRDEPQPKSVSVTRILASR